MAMCLYIFNITNQQLKVVCQIINNYSGSTYLFQHQHGQLQYNFTQLQPVFKGEMKTKQIQQAIKICLGTINKAVKQLPTDKRPLIMSRLHQVLNKYTKQSQTDDSLIKFKKQLEFNLNFIKLSHPNLDFKAPEQSKEKDPKPADNSKQTKQNEQQQFEHEYKLLNDDNVQVERLQQRDSFDQQLSIQKNVRQQVQFSNWFDGNVDPDHLKKHKELLERQHFSGDYWKDKERPKSIAKEFLLSKLDQKPAEMPKKDQILQDSKPYGIQKKDELWQKVKR